MTETAEKQLLHLVFGGELTGVDGRTFRDLSKLDIVGIYPNYARGARGLEGAGAGERRQCADALLHRPPAPPARSAGRLSRADEWAVEADQPQPRRPGGGRLRRSRLPQARAAHEPLRHRAGGRLRRASDPRCRSSPPCGTGSTSWCPFASAPQDRAASLVSRSADGELNAIALRHLGDRRDPRLGRARTRTIAEKGGVAALRGHAAGACGRRDRGASPPTCPRSPRVCGTGIVTLAQLSGRPIVPVAVVTSRRIDFTSLGPGEPRPAVRPRRDGGRRADPRRARRRRRGPRSGAARRRASTSTGCTTAPTRSSASRDPGAKPGADARSRQARRGSRGMSESLPLARRPYTGAA